MFFQKIQFAKFITSFLLTYFQALSFISISHAEIQTDDSVVKEMLEKYFKNIPNTDNKYIINEVLSKTIAEYFNGKISAFPLFKVSIKIDKTPVKIPWTLDTDKIEPQKKHMKKRYHYIKSNKHTLQKDNKRISIYWIFLFHVLRLPLKQYTFSIKIS